MLSTASTFATDIFILFCGNLCFIDDHLVEMFPFFGQLLFVTNLAVVHTLLQLPLNLVVDWVKVRTQERWLPELE